MRVFEFDINNIPLINDEISLCLGYFDGLHLGHLELIKKAKQSKYKSAVLTFSINNVNYKRDKFLTSILDRKEVLEHIGIDYLFIISFDKELMSLLPNDFIEKVLKPLNTKEIIIGRDYTFGYKKSGNINTLLNYNNKFYNLIVKNDVLINDKKVSTSYIITLIENGEIELANTLLNRNYKIKGTVIQGLHNGRIINYPTANIKVNDDYIIPRNGVYFTYIIINNKKYKSMTNIGVHPTISRLDEAIIETNIFDYNEDLYNKNVSLEFISFIRDEKKFNSLDELKKQLEKDKNYIYSIKK